MAIRNVEIIDNAVKTFKSLETIKVENTKVAFRSLYNEILSHKEEIIDAIDTFKYCMEKGLGKQFQSYCAERVGIPYFKIGENDRICFKFNEWRNTNQGPYNWFVETDGKEVFIHINNEYISDVPTMIKNAFYYKDNTTGDRVIAPIFEVYSDGKKSYTCHNAEKPLAALREFNNVLPNFLKEFFTNVSNLGKID